LEYTYDDLKYKRKHHPAWRLLQADNSALILSFLGKAFKEKNQRTMTQENLLLQLEDYLYDLRLKGEDYPRSTKQYLEEWAKDEKGWIRKFYPPGEDEPSFDLTPSTEKALEWIDSLGEKSFVGTESRLNIIFHILNQLVNGTEKSKEARLATLEEKKRLLEKEIEEVKAGEFQIMDERSIREHYQQLTDSSRSLLADFRSVEANFRKLDTEVRKKITLWSGEKAELLEEIFGERDTISSSDQGRSFRAFWDFLMNPQAQENLSLLLEKVHSLETVHSQSFDQRMQHIHFDWITAAEHTQSMVARLNRQLRNFIDDQARLENKRIMAILDRIEKAALSMNKTYPKGDFMSLETWKIKPNLPMDRSLFLPPLQQSFHSTIEEALEEDIDPSGLFLLNEVDREALKKKILRHLETFSQFTLADLIQEYPLAQGLAELITYLSIATEEGSTIIDDTVQEQIHWTNDQEMRKRVKVPRVIFSRSHAQ
jgi:translation elongation factor EF-1beta